MSVFEDLIDELKEENLLEETVISINRAAKAEQQIPPKPAFLDSKTTEENQNLEVAEEPVDNKEIFADEDERSPAPVVPDPESDDMEPPQPVDERELYRRRAMDEVSSLQMVEHVLSGIEREHMKMSPAVYDDLAVKKALHKYLQVTSPIDSLEHSEAEYALFQETENWFSALSKRDFNISVANLRRFCENSRPVLSSQALMALARFFRNSPFAEPVRGKFDFVVTRLFSREIGDEKRKLLFARGEMLGHIKNLYTNWSSLSIVSPGEESTAIIGAVAQFDAYVKEIETAESFDALIASDFFNRIRLFKEATSELFFESAVTSAAIEANVRIGNRFIDLVQKEREATSEERIEEKYGYTYDTIISNAASKTLLLLELLKVSREVEFVAEIEEDLPVSMPRPIVYERAPVDESKRAGLVTVNKWLVLATIVVVLASAGIYFWSENAASTQASIDVAPAVDISSTDLKAHLREASSNHETMYAVTQPTWDSLSDDEKKAFLAKALEFAKTRRMKRVNFLNNRGRTVGFASETRLEVFGPQ